MLKKCNLVMVVLLCLVLLCACGKKPAAVQTVPIEVTTQPATETTEATTEPPAVLELEMETLTLSQMGEQISIYSGQIPVQEIYWYSADASVAAVDTGVVTAMGKGIANVYAIYEDQKVMCTVTSEAEYTRERSPILSAPTYENVDESFFDDAVFVGDSISVKMSYYTNGRLGNAQFLAQTSYSVNSAVNDLMYTYYQGRKYQNLEDAIAATGAKKVFIMLGINDIGIHGVDRTLENWQILVDKIRQANPDIQIYIQSMTPMWSGAERRKLNNANIHACNFALRFFCEHNNCGFIDICPYLQDGSGGLAKEYCSDRYVHITQSGVDVWISVLRAYAYYPDEQ